MIFILGVLVEKSKDTYLKYNKNHLNDNYLEKNELDIIVGKMPDKIKKLMYI